MTGLIILQSWLTENRFPETTTSKWNTNVCGEMYQNISTNTQINKNLIFHCRASMSTLECESLRGSLNMKIRVFLVAETVWHFGKLADLLSCRELREEIDAKSVFLASPGVLTENRGKVNAPGQETVQLKKMDKTESCQFYTSDFVHSKPASSVS